MLTSVKQTDAEREPAQVKNKANIFLSLFLCPLSFIILLKKDERNKKQFGIKIANFLVIYLNDCKKRCDPKELRFDYCLQRLLKDETKNQVSKLDTRGGKDDGNTESDNAIVLRWFLNKSPRYAITCEKRM